ncbi:MAG TPA: HAD hydrolase-like protein [Candidatus Sulfotelmatobacter sp.]|jgi:phosphonatase-like hydrolase|nr:HAD hydrolase-like protein [Candidatus Sulfotelmatobacter sp.]
MSSIKLVVFDIAGTIIEDHGEVIGAFSGALRKNDIPFSDDELKRWKGASKREVIRHFVEQRGLSDSEQNDKVETTYQGFCTELESLYGERINPIEGAVATFAWCRERDIQIATTTGFYREVSDLILSQMGWRKMFAANISSSDVRRGRPAPFMIFRAMEATGVQDVREVVNVGDTPLDLQSGNNAGVRGVVGVLTGMHDRESLQREPHTHIIASVAELPEVIEREF